MNKSIFKPMILRSADSDNVLEAWERYIIEARSLDNRRLVTKVLDNEKGLLVGKRRVLSAHVPENVRKTREVLRNEEAITTIQRVALPTQMHGVSALLLKELEGMRGLQKDVPSVGHPDQTPKVDQ